jgi:hypothetical protein
MNGSKDFKTIPKLATHLMEDERIGLFGNSLVNWRRVWKVLTNRLSAFAAAHFIDSEIITGRKLLCAVWEICRARHIREEKRAPYRLLEVLGV